MSKEGHEQINFLLFQSSVSMQCVKRAQNKLVYDLFQKLVHIILIADGDINLP
jgi:hypothetical protein